MIHAARVCCVVHIYVYENLLKFCADFEGFCEIASIVDISIGTFHIIIDDQQKTARTDYRHHLASKHQKLDEMFWKAHEKLSKKYPKERNQ